MSNTVLTPLSPPPHLGKDGTRLWDALTGRYDFSDEGSQALLEQACRAIDRAERCRKVIDTYGELVEGKDGTFKEHPLLKAEVASRSLAVRCLARLGLHLEPIRPITGSFA